MKRIEPISNLKVSLLFADEDYDFAEKIAYGLIENGVKIYSDNRQLKGLAESWGIHKLQLIDETFNENIKYYIVIISKHFHRSKWTPYYKNKLLETAIQRKNIILPVLLGGETKEIPGITTFIGHLRIEPTDFQVVIDTFLLKVKQLDEISSQEIKPYLRIENILKIFNSKLVWKRHDQYIDKTDRIGYELFKATDSLIDAFEQYFLYLYSGVNLSKTHNLFIDKHPELLKEKNVIILFPKDSRQQRPETRKKNINDLFKPTKIFFLDEFIWEHCTSEEFRNDKSKFPINNFVDPHTNVDERTALSYLGDWVQTENSPILVIKGTGGIGKTTVVKKFSNFVLENIPNKLVIFIDSIEIINYLIKYSEFLDHPIELYDIYQAYCEVIDSTSHSKKNIEHDLFKANLDNGNIIFIIDGLDEVLAKLDKIFNLKYFLSSFYDNSNEMGKGKVILTCRNYFWDRNNPMIEIENIELLPFDERLAQLFFKSEFPNFSKAVKKGMQISNNLMNNNAVEGYIPYVLDIVSYIVKDELDSSDLDDPTFNSKLLNIAIRNDYILYKICSREIEKLGNTLDVDMQVKFFISFAIENKSISKIDKLSILLKNTIGEKISEETIESMKAHPILYVRDNTITFRYDFFEEHFKNIHLGSLLRQEVPVNIQVIEILSTYIRYNSSFCDDCCTRLGRLNDKVKIELIQIIDDIKNFDIAGNTQRYLKQKSTSSIFIIALKTLKRTEDFNINETTNLMKDFFLSHGTISDLALFDLNILNGDKIIFNFTGLRFDNCYFSGYEYFFECRFNKDTFFERCTFDLLYLKKGVKTTALPINFDFGSCKMDEFTSNILKISSQESYNIKQNLISDLKLFLKLFYTRGNIQSRPVNFLKAKYKRKVLKYDNLVNILTEISLIAEFDSFEGGGSRRIEIDEKQKAYVLKFIHEGTMSSIIKQTIQCLLEKN